MTAVKICLAVAVLLWTPPPAQGAEHGPAEHGAAEHGASGGIGVTRSAVQSAFERSENGGFVFRSGRLLDGTPRALAYSNERDVLIRLVGPPENLIQATMSVGLSGDKDLGATDRSGLVLFLGYCTPSWKHGESWLEENLPGVMGGGADSRVQARRRQVTIILKLENERVSLRVSGEDPGNHGHVDRDRSRGPVTSRSVLRALYRATGGEHWANNTNWLSNRPIGEWYGVKVNERGGITEVILYGSGLSGTIPPELAELKELEVLALGSSELTGGIPRELGSLPRIQNLTLSHSELSGSIPASLGQLSRTLVKLFLNGNQLTGKIPQELGQLEQLKMLRLDENSLSGSIPPKLGQLTQLTMLDLADNRLTGEIPWQLGRLAELEEFYLGGNQLSGCIPVGLVKAGVDPRRPLRFASSGVSNDLHRLGLEVCGEKTRPPGSGSLDQGALPSMGAAGDVESLFESEEVAQEFDPVSPSASTKLGYSRDRLQDRWEELDVSFTLRLNDDGTSAVMGSLPEDHSGKIILVFYGKGDEVHRAHLSVFFSKQKPATIATGVLLLTVLLGQAFPEWEGASDWVTDTLVELTRRAKSQTEAPEESIERETPAGVPAVVTLTYYEVLATAYSTLGQGCGDGVAGRIVLPVALGHRPLHHRPDSLPDPPSRLSLLGPDRHQRRQHVRRGDLAHQLAPQLRQGVLTQG